MTTLQEAHSKDARYFGDRPDWLIVLERTRDSSVLEETNFQAALEALGGESDTVAIERSSHFLCGWVEYLVVNPTDIDKVKIAEDLQSSLEDYPVLDEDALSKAEFEAAQEDWKNYGFDDYRKALKHELQASYEPKADGYSFDELFDIFDELEAEDFEPLVEKARRIVNWVYESTDEGTRFNIKGLVEATNLDELIDMLTREAKEDRRKADITKLGQYLGANQAVIDQAIKDDVRTVSGFRRLMDGKMKE